jgi:hypothetical protein
MESELKSDEKLFGGARRRKKNECFENCEVWTSKKRETSSFFVKKSRFARFDEILSSGVAFITAAAVTSLVPETHIFMIKGGSS